MGKHDDGLRPLIVHNVHGPMWTPVESGTTHAGIADLYGIYCDDHSWIECKRVWGHQLKIDPFQVQWHTRLQLQGGKSFIAARWQDDAGPRKGASINGIIVYEGCDIKKLARGTIWDADCWWLDFENLRADIVYDNLFTLFFLEGRGLGVTDRPDPRPLASYATGRKPPVGGQK